MAAAALGFDLSSSGYRTSPSRAGAEAARAATSVAAASTASFTSASTSTSGQDTAGRMRTRSFGFSLGSFGVTYTSRDLELDADQLDQAQEYLQTSTTKTAFLDELDNALLRQTLADNTRRPPDSKPPARGAAAYARMATGYNEPGRSLLGVA